MEESSDKIYKRIYKRNWKNKELEVYEIDRFGELYNLIPIQDEPVLKMKERKNSQILIIILVIFFILLLIKKK